MLETGTFSVLPVAQLKVAGKICTKQLFLHSRFFFRGCGNKSKERDVML